MRGRSFSKKVTAVFLTVSMLLSVIAVSATVNKVSAAAGTYYVEITAKMSGSNNFNGTYGGYDTIVNDSIGVTLVYVESNGTGTVKYKDWDWGNNSLGYCNSDGTYVLKGTFTGFPKMVYAYVDDNYAFGSATLTVSKITVAASSSATKTTLWEGTLQVKSKTNAYGASIDWDGVGKADYHETDDTTFVTTTTLNWAKPAATKCTISGGTSALTVPKTGSVSGAAYTASAVDQYGVKWKDDPTITYSGNYTGITFENSKFTVTSEANNKSASTRTVSVTAAVSGTNAASATANCIITNASYNYTFVNGEEVLDSGTHIYSFTGIDYLGETPVKASDADYHYNFSSWSPALDSEFNADTVYEAQFTAVQHNYGEPSVTKQPTCEETGSQEYTCEDCGYVKIQSLPALDHVIGIIEKTPADGEDGYRYAQCTVCGQSFALDAKGNITGSAISESEAQQSSKVPAPKFNQFSAMQSTGTLYDFSARGASLFIQDSLSEIQPMRFTASLAVPEGAQVTQFGYIYTQSQYAADISIMQKGNEEYYNFTYPCSVYTEHIGDNGESVYTFNLVINVKNTNWKRNYCARAYIDYEYNGKNYTVYDSSRSTNSVSAVAYAVTRDAGATQAAKDYCQEVYNYAKTL